ncbi:MAG: PilN domain-containing protein [Cryobacterium sp.]|nr:PilN domain-containing protein [Oligoflexia bacterium]
MIKINLKSRKAAVGVSAGGAGGEIPGISGVGGKFASLFARVKSGGGGFSADQSELKPAIILAVVYLTIGGVGWWFASEEKSKQLAEVSTEIAGVESKISLLDSELGKTKGYEAIKKSLEADEKTIRTKITTIQELIRERGAPPKILMTLSETVPANVWLREFSLKDRKFHLLGSSDGMDVVSDFMKGLEETLYFKGVVLKSSKQDSKLGRQTAQFELDAERR